MTYLKTTENGVVWPYSFYNLQQDNPNVSFCTSPTAEDLALFSVYIVAPSDPPQYDPRLQRIAPSQPELVDGQWTDAWTIRDATPEEIADYDAYNRPQPDWATFKTTLLEDEEVNSVLASAIPTAPVAALALPAALISASSGLNSDDFFSLWNTLRQKGIVLQLLVDRVVNLAEFCNLPSSFVSSLSQELP